MKRPMTWQPEIDELKARERLAYEMGGAEKVARQRHGGKLTVRERIAQLLDSGSFHEVGAIAGKARYDANGRLIEFTPVNFGRVRGLIDGRPVVGFSPILAAPGTTRPSARRVRVA